MKELYFGNNLGKDYKSKKFKLDWRWLDIAIY